MDKYQYCRTASMGNVFFFDQQMTSMSHLQQMTSMPHECRVELVTEILEKHVPFSQATLGHKQTQATTATCCRSWLSMRLVKVSGAQGVPAIKWLVKTPEMQMKVVCSLCRECVEDRWDHLDRCFVNMYVGRVLVSTEGHLKAVALKAHVSHQANSVPNHRMSWAKPA